MNVAWEILIFQSHSRANLLDQKKTNIPTREQPILARLARAQLANIGFKKNTPIWEEDFAFPIFNMAQNKSKQHRAVSSNLLTRSGNSEECQKKSNNDYQSKDQLTIAARTKIQKKWLKYDSATGQATTANQRKRKHNVYSFSYLQPHRWWVRTMGFIQRNYWYGGKKIPNKIAKEIEIG